jgi:hypothetical protein
MLAPGARSVPAVANAAPQEPVAMDWVAIATPGAPERRAVMPGPATPAPVVEEAEPRTYPKNRRVLQTTSP